VAPPPEKVMATWNHRPARSARAVEPKKTVVNWVITPLTILPNISRAWWVGGETLVTASIHTAYWLVLLLFSVAADPRNVTPAL
jgi:hypothetical protein